MTKWGADLGTLCGSCAFWGSMPLRVWQEGAEEGVRKRQVTNEMERARVIDKADDIQARFECLILMGM